MPRNICRSPTEGLIACSERDLNYIYIDSAGTAAYHVGEPANSKSQFTANKYGVHLPSRARLFEYEDLKERFDSIWIVQIQKHIARSPKLKNCL